MNPVCDGSIPAIMDYPPILVKRSFADNVFAFKHGCKLAVLGNTVDAFPTGKNIDAATAHPSDKSSEVIVTIIGKFEHDEILEENEREFELHLSAEEATHCVTIYREFSHFVAMKISRSKEPADFEVGLGHGLMLCAYFDGAGKRLDEVIFKNSYGKASLRPESLEMLTSLFDAIAP